MTVKQSGKTQGGSDCKAGRKNSRRKSTCNCLFLVPPGKYSIILAVFASNHSILLRFLPSFLAKIYPSRRPFFFRPFFSLFFVYLLIFWFFLSLLSTPREIFYYCDGFRRQSLDFASVLAQFSGQNLPVALPFFFQPLWLIFRFLAILWLFFGFFLSLLSTPRESDCKAERENSRRKRL